jgi:hypothetical protein
MIDVLFRGSNNVNSEDEDVAKKHLNRERGPYFYLLEVYSLLYPQSPQ